MRSGASADAHAISGTGLCPRRLKTLTPPRDGRGKVATSARVGSAPGADRPVGEEQLEAVGRREVVLRLRVVEAGSHESVPGQCTGYGAGPVGEVRGFLRLAVRLEVGVPQTSELGPARLEVELRRGCSQRNGQGVEWVRNAAVAPVEEEVAAIPDEDLAVVEVVVLDGLADAVGSQLTTHLLEPRHRSDRPLLLPRREPAHRLREHGAQPVGEN